MAWKTLTEGAHYLNMRKSTLSSIVHAENTPIPAYKRGRAYMVNTRDMDNYMRSLPTAAEQRRK